ncbi:MAG TPA: 3-deoxy-D-manno-octulosonic acid transferase [Terriglobia bacterium]|nr:3-deoxy-D-manno-octulosonic acid transferase [Terriglobia bacterium]
MGLLYSLLVTLAALVAAPWYLVRYGLRGLPRGYWSERLGRLPASLSEPEEAGAIWIHAVSVGETLAVAGLAGEMRRRFPTRPVYLSHVTPTGRAAGEARIPGVAGRFYLPLDWKWAVHCVFDRLHPSLLLVAETELWPNLLGAARERGTPVVLVNARLSEGSFRGYRRFAFFFKGVLGAIDRVFAQTERDAGRFRELGVPGGKVTVAGNLKFDGRPPELGELPRRARHALRDAGRGPVLVAGSTMAGEERLLLRAWDRLRKRFPRAFLVLAPRHPQRFEEVAQALGDEGRRFVRRTALDPSEFNAQVAGAEILLLNTIGELAGMFELADVAFVGGSLVASGGHNLLEPAYWAKPVLFGPHMENFRDAAEQFVSEKAGYQVQGPEELALRVAELFTDPARRDEVGRRAKRLLERESGATKRIADALAEWLGEPSALQPSAVGGRAL